jgi:hypothetical protein
MYYSQVGAATVVHIESWSSIEANLFDVLYRGIKRLAFEDAVKILNVANLARLVDSESFNIESSHFHMI